MSRFDHDLTDIAEECRTDGGHPISFTVHHHNSASHHRDTYIKSAQRGTPRSQSGIPAPSSGLLACWSEEIDFCWAIRFRIRSRLQSENASATERVCACTLDDSYSRSAIASAGHKKRRRRLRSRTSFPFALNMKQVLSFPHLAWCTRQNFLIIAHQ